MWYALNRSFFKAVFRFRFRYEVEGQHHEPAPPYLLIANHTSALDILLVVLAVRERVHFMTKHEIGRNFILGLWVRSLGSFFVRRGGADPSAVQAALRRLGEGKVVAVFPEGMRSPDGRLFPLKTGSAYLALRTGLPVLPIAIIGANRIMPKGAIWPRRGRIVLKVGQPLVVPRIDGKVSRSLQVEWTARFAQALIDLLPADQHPHDDPISSEVARRSDVKRRSAVLDVRRPD